MKRFVIRNYGPSRQVPYKGQSVCLSNDQCVETDNEEMADVFREEERITVTDRGEELAKVPNSSAEEPKEKKVVVDPNELSYDDMSLDELRTLAKDRGVAKAGKLKIGGLIEALEDYDEAEVAEPVLDAK